MRRAFSPDAVRLRKPGAGMRRAVGPPELAPFLTRYPVLKRRAIATTLPKHTAADNAQRSHQDRGNTDYGSSVGRMSLARI